jgi:hypothetical protein
MTMFGTTSTHSAAMLASVALLVAASIKSISGLPSEYNNETSFLILFADLHCLALSWAFHKGFTQGVPSNIVWPSYVAHLSQAQPDRTFGPQQNAFVYRIPGESQDIGTQMAFTMPDDDDDHDGDDNDVYKRDYNEDDLKSFCMLGFLDVNELWGGADWVSQVIKDHDFTIFGYLEAAVVFSPEDTWNQQPVVDYGNVFAKVHVSVSLLSNNFALLLYVKTRRV